MYEITIPMYWCQGNFYVVGSGLRGEDEQGKKCGWAEEVVPGECKVGVVGWRMK